MKEQNFSLKKSKLEFLELITHLRFVIVTLLFSLIRMINSQKSEKNKKINKILQTNIKF